MGAVALKLTGKRADFRRQEGLATGDDDVTARVFLDLADDLGDAP